MMSLDRGITRLAVAVLEQAIRDAQLVDVGHRVAVCRLETWPTLTQQRIQRSRRWLMDESPEGRLVFWTRLMEISVTEWTHAIWTRIEWTQALEARAPRETSVPRAARGQSPYRQEGDNT